MVRALHGFQEEKRRMKDAWFAFDTVLVGMMVFETWLVTVYIMFAAGGFRANLFGNAAILRLLRLLRLSRLAKMIRYMPELMVLIKGMVSASRVVFFTMLLLLICIYVFAIVFRQLTDDTEAGHMYFPRSWDRCIRSFCMALYLTNWGTCVHILQRVTPPSSLSSLSSYASRHSF